MNTKRERTRQYSLTLALKYILSNSIATKSKLRNHYNLDPTTILKIESGRELTSSAHRRYMEVFVGILNQYRVMHEKCEQELNKILADILLVEYGIKTDEERTTDYENERRTEFLKHICSRKT